MDVLVLPIGSHGDLHPFLGIARALCRRGHSVKVIANGYYQALAGAMGLEFAPVGTAEEFLAIARDPDIWNPTRGNLLVAQSMKKAIPDFYQAVLDHAIPGKTVLVYSTLNFGARLAQETLGLAGISVHLSPAIFFSSYDPPKIAKLPMPLWLPLWARRSMMSAALHLSDRFFAPPLNLFRKKLNLPPVRDVWRRWVHSPQRVIGLFPSWYAAPQPDWPPQTILTDFPLFDERDVTPMPRDVADFLDAGPPPIAFTPGSANFYGHRFFAAAVKACRILECRGLLLTRHDEQIPGDLPSGVMHAGYAPFSQLLPRCAALVHHGGIGTTAQGLAAGVPQLMMPMGFDQPDNSQRCKRFGVADWLWPKQFTGHNVARKLDALIGSSAAACRQIMDRFKPDPLAETVRCIEAMDHAPASCPGASSR